MSTEDLISIGIIILLVAVRILLWSKFKNNWRANRIAISTAQLVVVIAAVLIYSSVGAEHTLTIASISVAGIVFLSSLPIKRNGKVAIGPKRLSTAEEGLVQKEQIRSYFRSLPFRICSWVNIALLGLFFWTRQNWFLYAAVIISIFAMLPALRRVGYSQRIDLQKPHDRRYLIWVFLYVLVIVFGAYLYAKYS